MPSRPETNSSIATLLRETETAHGAYETTVLGGKRDEQWAAWYANYLLDHGLGDFLPGAPDAVDLAATLTRLDREFPQSASGTEWPEFYAHGMITSPD